MVRMTKIVSNPDLDVGRVYFFFDAGVPLKRLKLLPGYKSSRKEKRKLLSEEDHAKAMGQLHLVREMLQTLGVTCLAYKDREADDCCAAAVTACLKSSSANVPLVVSNDRDLLQCVAMGGQVYAKDTVIDFHNFSHHTGGILPAEYVLYRTLTGDTSDDIDGVVGCGPVRAREAVERVRDDYAGTPTDPHVALNILAKHYAGLGDKANVWQRNLVEDVTRLHDVIDGITLAGSFGGTKTLTANINDPTPGVDRKAFLRFCSRLKFNSVMADPTRFVVPFEKAYARA